MNDPAFQAAVRKGFLANTLGSIDRAVAPIRIRNDAFYPFSSRIGYESGEAYWHDSSSYRFVRFISVPFLHVTAADDFLVSRPSRNKIGFCLENPNVMVIETRCGGHLGWQETPPESTFGASSWADVASADFFQSLMDTNMEHFGSPVGRNYGRLQGSKDSGKAGIYVPISSIRGDVMNSMSEVRSRL